ncbi:hypothetical protein ABVT39_023873, partial [Epinephelus coioides]
TGTPTQSVFTLLSAAGIGTDPLGHEFRANGNDVVFIIGFLYLEMLRICDGVDLPWKILIVDVDRHDEQQ